VSAEPLVRARGLGLTYANGYRALEGVDLDVHRGEFLVVLGLSGSGKSTLLRCLNRLLEPTEGTVEVDGRDVTHVTGRALRGLRARMGMIFQRFHLVTRATALANVLTGSLERAGAVRALLGLWPRADREEAHAHLATVGLTDHAYHRADALSGGQQQRVAIARALLQHPDVILADEPVASLDPATSHGVLGHLEALRRERGLTIVACLHFLSLAREYGTRVVALKAGRKVFEGPPTAITDDVFRAVYGEDAAQVEVR